MLDELFMINVNRNQFLGEIIESINKNLNSIALADYLGDEVSYGRLYEETTKLNEKWTGLGIFPGDKIAILANNSTRWLEVYLAAILNGYVAVLVPNNLSQESNIDVIRHSNCRILYTTRENAAFIHSALPELLVFEIQSFSPMFLGKKSGILSVRQSLQNIDENSVCTILYSSGSMGEPKAVLLSYRSIAYQIRLITRWMREYQGSRFQVNILPFSHIFGLLCDALAPICLGVQVIIMGTNLSTVKLINALQEYQPSIFLSVPMMIEDIIRLVVGEDCYNFLSESELCEFRQRIMESFGGNINAILTGGASISPELESFLVHDLQLPFVTGYGTTECGILSAGSVGKYICGSCGRMLDSEVVRIDKAHKTDMSGEVQIKGKNVFAGYYNNANATSLAFTDDGWFKTGDLGYIDDGGNLYITGRCKDMLLASNGENIYPETIEAIFNASPYIKESILVNKRGGGKLLIIIVLDKRLIGYEKINEIEINKHIHELIHEANKLIPGFTYISSYEIIDGPLERTNKGSLMRFRYNK